MLCILMRHYIDSLSTLNYISDAGWVYSLESFNTYYAV